MSNAKHTPGPWKIESDESIGRDCIQSPLIGRIAILCEHDSGQREWDQDAANARLIAAAPELLAALKAVAGWMDRNNRVRLPAAFDGVRPAIALAGVPT